MLGARDHGSTSTLGLAIAAMIFASAFMAADLMVGHPTSVDGAREAYDAEAATGLDLLVGTAGSAPGGGWVADPDHMTRFGLALEGQPNFLDYAKIRALRNGTMTSTANGWPDYPEVVRAMGLAGGDVHLRTYPAMPSFDDPRFVKETHGRLAYLGHYTGAVAPVNVTSSGVVVGTALNVSVTLRNDAAFSSVFTVDVSLGADDTDDLVTLERNTGLLLPGQTTTVYAAFERLASWSARASSVHVGVVDPFGNDAIDGAGHAVTPQHLALAPPTGGSNTYDPTIAAADVYAVSGGAVAFALDDHKGDGTRANPAPTVRFVLVGPDGHEWQNASVALSKTKATTVSCANCTVVGNYTGIVWDAGMTRRAQDVMHVSAAKMFTQKSTLDPIASTEIRDIQALVSTFDPTRHDSATAPEGDLFGDDSNGASDIVDVMSRYSTIVVGSQIQQNCLTPSSVKNGLADWVQAGGNLVVLGTYGTQSRWLEPIYHAAQDTASGGISAPDPTHPILVAPEHLQYERYLDRGRAWSVKSDEPFTHVLTRGVQGGSSEDTLVVANAGAYNNGTVTLTSYMPGSLTSPQDDVEATRLLHNLLSQSYTMLFLDYGPPIPPDASVGSDQRLVAVPHPNVPGAVVEVRLVLYRWG